MHWDHGLLNDYDYSFLYARAVAKLKEIRLCKAKENQHGPMVSNDIIPPDIQPTDNDNELLLHHTISIANQMQIILLTIELQGTFPFMSIQLLMAGVAKIKHSEKHNLESFFWVLLYICTMFEGPGQRCVNGQWADLQYPFDHWLGKMDNLEEVGENVTAYGIGSFCNSALGCPGGPRDLLDWFVHPCFKPLIPMLKVLCDKVFLVSKQKDAALMRMPQVTAGDYDSVLDVLKTALSSLPAHDGPLPPHLS